MVYALVVHVRDLRAGRRAPGARSGSTRRTGSASAVEHRNPLLGLVAPLERMLQAPDGVPARVGAAAGRRGPLGTRAGPAAARQDADHARPGRRDADAISSMALAEFRALGERWGISFALTELAERIAMRGEFAGACEYYEEAIAVVTEVGAIEDVIRMRSRQAQLYWLLGDEDSSAAAMAEAQRCAERVTWPDALAELALSKAELARWGGDAEEARRQLGVATTMLGDEAELATSARNITTCSATSPTISSEARAHRAAACQAASEARARTPDRPGTRRGRGPGAAPRPVRAGRAAARGKRRRARTAGSFPPGRGQDRADSAASPRRGAVRRGDACGSAAGLA